MARLQKHLTRVQQEQLKTVLRKYTKLFSGKLGAYPHKKMSLDVDPKDLKRLRYQRPYPIPHVNEALFKQELDRLCEIGVLKFVDRLVDFAAPTSLVPKKDQNRV